MLFIQNVFCKYEMYAEELKTDPVTGTSNPEFQFEKKFSYKPCTQEVLHRCEFVLACFDVC